MYYTGFADKAGDSIDVQIRATLELGWSNIEPRSVDGANLTDVTDETFEQVCEKLAAAGVRINCFASAIANWSRDPRSEEDFQYSVEALRRAIPRMQHLGTLMIRGMSFAVVRDEAPDSPELETLIFGKVRRLVEMCEEAGVLYLHENCMNYMVAISGKAAASFPRSSTPFPARAMATWPGSWAISCRPATTAAFPSSRTWRWSITMARPSQRMRFATTITWTRAGTSCDWWTF